MRNPFRSKKPHKIVFVSDSTGKKLFTARYSDSEFFEIKRAALLAGISIEDLLNLVIEDLKNAK